MTKNISKKTKESSKSDESLKEEGKKDQEEPSVNSLTAVMKCEKNLTLEDLWAVIDDSMKKRQKKVSIARNNKVRTCKHCQACQKKKSSKESSRKETYTEKSETDDYKFTLFPVFNSFGEELDNVLSGAPKMKIPCSPLGHQNKFQFDLGFLPGKVTNSEIFDSSKDNSNSSSMLRYQKNYNFDPPKLNAANIQLN